MFPSSQKKKKFVDSGVSADTYLIVLLFGCCTDKLVIIIPGPLRGGKVLAK